jgi:hypothetical protein
MHKAAKRAAAKGTAALLAVLCTLLATACQSGPVPARTSPLAQAPASPVVRPPAVGQQWVYRVRDLFSGRIVDEVTETVVSTSPQIHIQRVSKEHGALDDEIHATWGMLVQDSHWSMPVRFDKPLPAWPPVLAPAGASRYRDRYQMPGDKDASVRWNLTLRPVRWESVTVPAGTFDALAVDNFITYDNGDLYAVGGERQESVWFAPAIGRWVLRQSRGTVLYPGRGSGLLESYLEWELVSWR